MSESFGKDNFRPAVVHVDLDGARHIFRARGWKYPADADPLFESGMCSLLELLDATKIRATLFVIAEDLKDRSKRKLLEEAVDRGHEIGSHTTTHRKLTALTADEKHREVFESRDSLQRELGVTVQGFRAPGFDIDREAIELVSDAGYLYDTSLFPGRSSARKIEAAEVPAVPHRVVTGKALWELPLPRYRPLPFSFHPSYSLVIGMPYFRVGMRLLQGSPGPMVLLMHLTDLAGPLPGEMLPNWKARLYTLSFISNERKRSLCETMLDCVRRSYTFTSTSTLLEDLADRQSPGKTTTVR